jgi:hypothetical protein
MRKKWLQILILIFLVGAVVWAGKGIFKYNVFSTHDGDHHIARVYDVIKTITEGQFPLRWAGSLNYFCGVPIYNFYYPLIYYLAAGINLFTKNVIFTLKIIEFASLLFGTIFFYLWIKSETKKELSAIGGALTYLYAPYRFSLILVRGSPEYLAYAVLPIVLYFYSLCFNSTGKKSVFYAFIASILGALLTISHNFTVMFLVPIILLYLIIKIISLKLDIKKIGWLALSFIGAFGMGSFFIGPALLEQKYTKIGQGFLEWQQHFPELWQLIRSKWGYFYSAPGTVNDGMSFMLGYAQWIILIVALIFIVYQVFKNKFKFWKVISENIYIIFFFLASVLSIYLMLPISIPVWDKIRILQEIQFPWRILGIAVFTTSALFSFLLAKINSKIVYIGIFIGIGGLTVVGTRNFMLPQPVSVQDLYKYNDFEKLHQERYSTTTLGDEVIDPNAKNACWYDTPLVSTEKEKISDTIVERGNTYGSVKFDFPKGSNGKNLIMGLGYFPGNYNFTLNGESKIQYSDCGGRVCLPTSELRNGQNIISWRVGQSPIESFFNYVTLGFFILWLIILFIRMSEIYKDKHKVFHFILVLLIFGAFLFFRFYNLSGRVLFGWDQERDALATANILAGKLTLLGPRVQGPTGFFLPPYFFYLLTPFYALVKGSPVAIINFIVFWSTLFFTTSYLIISKIFNKWVAFLFLALWTVNPLAVSMDTIAWNPVVIPTLFIVFIYLYYLCLKTAKNSNIFLLGLIFGLGVSFHTQFIFTSLLLTPLLIDLIKNKKFSLFGYLITGVIVPFLPILFFDLRHNFLNIKQLFDYSLNSGLVENRALVVWGNVVSFATGLHPTAILGLVFYVFISLGLLFTISKITDDVRKKIFMGLTCVWIFSVPLFYVILKNPSEYYFNYLLVIAILAVAYLVSMKKVVSVIVLILIIPYFSWKSLPLLSNAHLSLGEKINSVLFLKDVTENGSAFNISFDVPFNEDAGFRYLLNYYKVRYSGNSKDPLIEFVIPYQKRPETFTVGQIGIYIPSGWLENNWLKHE